MNRDWDSDFLSIVEEFDVDDLSDPRAPEKLNPWEIHRMVILFNEASAFLSDHLMSLFMKKDVDIPEYLTPVMRDLAEVADEISVHLSITTNEDCPDCSSTIVCEECYEELEGLEE